MFWRLLDRFNDTMEAIFFVSYLGLMLVIGWTLFDDDRVLFILIVLYVVVVAARRLRFRRSGRGARSARRPSRVPHRACGRSTRRGVGWRRRGRQPQGNSR